MSENKTYDLIEGYLNGELKGTDLLAFEKQLLESIDLQAKVASHQLANAFIRKNTLLSIKDLVAQEDQKATSKTTIKKFVALGIVALLAGLALYFYVKKKEPNILPHPVPTSSAKLPLSSPSYEKEIVAKKTETKQAPPRTTPLEKTNSVTAPSLHTPVQQQTKDVKVWSHEEQTTISVQTTPALSREEKKVAAAEANNPLAKLCDKVELFAYVHANATCVAAHTGSIHLSGFSGGTSPYRFEVKSEGGETETSALNLAAGRYSVYLYDAKGCSKTFEHIVVKQQDCQTDFAINPAIGEVWEIPVYPVKGSLTVYDEKGNVYFRAEVEADSKSSWSGYSSNGELNTGFFPFTISYQDGHSKHGSVSIGK